MITFKKDADGEWGILCPADQAVAGATLTVTKRNGETSTVTIATVADEPKADGRIFCWLAAEPRKATGSKATGSVRTSATGQRYRTSRKACTTGGNCSSFGNGRSCGGHDCDGW
jgi:hypothetical protein